jgi:hypothetical protein
MTSEKENNVFWALKRLRDLLRCPYNIKIIVTAQDQALMKVVASFPQVHCYIVSVSHLHERQKKIPKRNA